MKNRRFYTNWDKPMRYGVHISFVTAYLNEDATIDYKPTAKFVNEKREKMHKKLKRFVDKPIANIILSYLDDMSIINAVLADKKILVRWVCSNPFTYVYDKFRTNTSVFEIDRIDIIK